MTTYTYPTTEERFALHVHSYQLIAGARDSAVSGISEVGARITRLVPKATAEAAAKALDAGMIVWLDKDNTVTAFSTNEGDIDDAGFLGPSFICVRCDEPRVFGLLDHLTIHLAEVHND